MLLDQFYCTVVKLGNSLLEMRREVVWVERHMIRIICGVRLVDTLLIDVLRDWVGVVVKIEDMIIQSCLRYMVMSSIKTSTPK